MEALRQRDEATLGNRLRAPLHALAALEDLAHARMRLQLLQQIVHRQLRVAVVEPDDHPDRDHVVAHRVDERPAELAVLPPRREAASPSCARPAQRLRDLPDLLHAERPHLRVLAAQPEAVERRAGQMALRPLGEDRHARGDVGAGLEVRQLLAAAPASAGRPCARRLRARRRRAAARRDVSGRIVAPSDSASSASHRPSCESDAT